MNTEDRSDRYRFPVVLFGAAAIPVFFLPLTPQDPFLLPKDVLFSCVACLLGCLLFFRRALPGPSAKLLAPALLFVTAMAVSLPGSTNYREGLQEFTRWIYILVIFFSSVRIDWTRRRLATLMSVGVAVSGFVSIFALLEYFQVLPFFRYPLTEGRLYSFFGHQNIMGQYLAITLLWGIGLFAHTTSKPAKSLFLLLSFITASALVVSFCRSAIIAAALGSGIFMIYLWRTRTLTGPANAGTKDHRAAMWLLLAGVMLLTLSFIAAVHSEKTVRLISEALARKDSNRLIIWKDTFRMFADSPARGVGLGNFPIVYPLYETGDFPWQTLYAYNEYLQMLAEAGIIGLSGFAVFLCSVLAGVREKAASRRASPDSVLYMGILCGCIVTGLQSMVSYDLHSPASAYLFFAGLGVLCAGPPEETENKPNPRSNAAVVAICLAVILSLCGIFGEYRKTMGHYFQGRALLAEKANDTERSISCSLKALEYRPFDPEYHYLIAKGYLEAGQTRLATEHIQEAKKLSPYRYGNLRGPAGKPGKPQPEKTP